MKNIKTKYKAKWKRDSAATGKWKSFEQNDLRGYSLDINGATVGWLRNMSKGHSIDDFTKDWVFLLMTKDNPIQFKKHWKYEDVDTAKIEAVDILYKIIQCEEKDNEAVYKMKLRILEFGRLKLVD